MRKYIYSVMAAIAMLASCSQDGEINEVTEKAQPITTIGASSEIGMRAVVSSDQKAVNWETGDQLGVLGTNISNEKKNVGYTLADGAGTTAGTFTNGSSDITAINAVMYPYQAEAAWDGSKLTCRIPTVQKAVKGSFDKDAAIMYSIGDKAEVKLKYAVNFLKVTVSETNVHAIAIGSTAALSGTMEVTASDVTLAAKGTLNSVVLTAGENNCLEAGTYYIAVKKGDIASPTISYTYYNTTDHTATVKTKAASGNLTFAEGKNVKSISVDFSNGTVIEREAVQLWDKGPYFATMNVGASTPEDYGDYFAWGETTGYKQDVSHKFDWDNYSLCNGSYSALNKYCIDTKKGIVDNKTVLDPEDDAATANWGGTWRMPTSGEFTTFVNSCTFELVKESKKNVGINVKNNSYSSKSVFFPTAGYRDKDNFNSGYLIYCWSSSLYTVSQNYQKAYYFQFNCNNSGSRQVTSYNRRAGLSVRAVCQ